ncbi:hypothetical protein SNE40_022670 [Patella caerulea]|uniref:Uncharacterized protein n=1 Tax=Patella caerulea TaxID=87958 RepID=A0AAN8G186_PATCE
MSENKAADALCDAPPPPKARKFTDFFGVQGRKTSGAGDSEGQAASPSSIDEAGTENNESEVDETGNQAKLMELN